MFFFVPQMNTLYGPLFYKTKCCELGASKSHQLVLHAHTHSAVPDVLLFHLVALSQVAADDLDQGQNGQVTYSIRSSSMSGLFKIDPLTGSISTAAIMDREIWTQTK